MAREVQRRLRLVALRRELAKWGIDSRLVHHHARRWCLHLRGPEPESERAEITCAGAHGVYVLLTVEGELLGCADERGTRLTAELLARRLAPARVREAA